MAPMKNAGTTQTNQLILDFGGPASPTVGWEDAKQAEEDSSQI
jgi:hypothetical protein